VRLAIELRRTVGEVAGAMRLAELCAVCKGAFAIEPGLCSECAATLDGWLRGGEGLTQQPPSRDSALNEDL
jgi:hypothetical protein